jgi:hypothetical protein
LQQRRIKLHSKMDDVTKSSQDTGSSPTGTGTENEQIATKKQRTEKDQQLTDNTTATTPTSIDRIGTDTGSRTVNEDNNNNIPINNEKAIDNVSNEKGKYECYHERKKNNNTSTVRLLIPSFYINILYVFFGEK